MARFITNKISLQKGNFNDLVQKILNKTTEKTASTKEVVKVAEQEEGKDSGHPAAEAKLVNVPKKEEGTVKGNASEKKTECVESGQPQAEAKLVNKPEVKENPYGGKKEDKKASSQPKFQKVAKLSASDRSMLRDYWLTMYGPDYVEAMLAEQ